MSNRTKDKAVADAFAFLRSQQQSDGSFLSYSSTQPYTFHKGYTYKTTFANSLILRCIAHSTYPLTAQLAAYISRQAQKNGAYNYWDKNTPEYTHLPYPNDLDDTFCALSALTLHNPTNIDGTHLAQATILLMQAESRAGGPYYTWLTDGTQDTWKDIDVVVNANILYFLNLHSIQQHNLSAYISNNIRSRNLYSPFYPSQFHVLYFLCFATTNTDELAQCLEKLLSVTPPRSALECAMTLTVLKRINNNRLIGRYQEQLLSMQRSDGSWPAAAVCIDPSREGQKYFNGSEALTTAFAIQALDDSQNNRAKATSNTSLAEPLIQRAAGAANRQIADTDMYIQKDLSRHITSIVEGRYAHEIIASPYLFYKSLARERDALPKKFLESVSAANTFGWIAYTIYDDFIDEEGIPGLLPAANVAHRKSLINFFQAVSYKPSFREYILKTFNTIDAANKWELTHCRQRVHKGILDLRALPDFGDQLKLAEKSIGHTLPFLLVSLYCGLKLTDKRFKKLEAALTHYLIARQLHDDAHDWQADLSNGHMSFVVTEVLKQKNVPFGSYNLAKLLKDLQNTYWRKTLPSTCALAEHHLQAAQNELTAIGYESTSLSTLVKKLQDTTKKTMNQQKDTLLFLDTYTELTKNRNRTSNNQS